RKTNKLESAVERLGGIRFSGDLRLRADAQLRPSLANPGPGLAPLPHIQNIRARYRLRLNFDADVNPLVAFHGQLATGPINNPQTTNQDFTSTNIRHPFFISEMWVDFHPVKGVNLQAGRVQEVFADNSRFLFDDDIRFNGFNQKVVKTFKEPVAGFRSIELRAGQYILSNPNVAVVTDGNLGPTGAMIGSTGRGANMFHQGVLFNQRVSGRASQQFGGDIQLYRNPNQIQFASTMGGLPVIIQGGIGLLLSAPITGTGNATTTPNGPIYTARHFQVARLTYRLDHAGFKRGEREYPISFNLQVARNVGTGQNERDGMLASFKLGEVKKTWDQSFLYVFGLKGANAIISQVTDDDLGTGTGVNMRTHHLRWDVGIMKGIQLQSLLFIQNQLSNSRQYPNFFVPLEAYAPRQYKIQEQLVFTF
ncbi:MAG TPA: putative porin, partial [Blastocatellia bacterium]|nr:putative porin [Blastocatellia bacterium]